MEAAGELEFTKLVFSERFLADGMSSLGQAVHGGQRTREWEGRGQGRQGKGRAGERRGEERGDIGGEERGGDGTG